MNTIQQTMEEQLMKEMEIRERLDANYYYNAKRSSVKAAQEMGLTDAEIEAALNIRIRPEDRQQTA